MPAPDSIRTLCETFALHRAHYTSSGYNETELRREFLDPFFTALGWDVDNKAGYADAYKDIIHEDAIRIGGYTKAPDYCFRIGGTRKVFVEAKKPSVNIEGDIAPAYQVRRYGWSAKLPLCILSDFEEFAVYDTRIKPVKTDRPSSARILYYTFDQYVDKWDEIAAVFARDAILRGSFDKYAETSKGKRGTGAVDDTFLAEIERWRELLARNLALRNPALSVRDLNFAVQKTIDRLIFLRICEDRGTEDYGRLQTLLNGERTYQRLMQLFHQADARYNSGLFHFDNGEKGRSDAPDTLTTHLEIDDKTLKDILRNLYYPDSPYEFSVLPADILGQVYEQFLGKTIRLTDGHQAKIEEKPEVRKAGGVYYTPGYIVDYIVRNTLGRLLDGDDPEKPQPVSIAKAAEIKVLDPACGSGSFLIVAYQYLLDWHLRQYTAAPATGALDPEKAKRSATGKSPKIYQAAGDTWRLTTAERKRILLNSIHGVDIDSQAVEVTKLSLLLKVLEGETQQQLQRDYLSERQRILPDLGGNIKCGNSLIGPDFYENEQMLLLDDESQYRINVFDWKKAYPEIIQRGGFDCVIGNPPYIRIQSLRETSPETATFYQQNYLSAAKGNFDIYVCFIEHGRNLMNAKGRLGFIVPSKFLTTDYGAPIRKLLSHGNHVESLIDFGSSLVFTQASTYTCLLFLRSESGTITSVATAKASAFSLQELKVESIPSNRLTEAAWDIQPERGHNLRTKIKERAVRLLDLPVSMNRGSSTGNDSVFILEDETAKNVESAYLRVPIFATDYGRYHFTPNNGTKLIVPYTTDKRAEAIAENKLAETAPQTFSHLHSNKDLLLKRKQFSRWHLFSAPRAIGRISYADILVPLLADKGIFALLPDEWKGRICLMASGGFGITLEDGCDVNRQYLLGLLNSRLLFWELKNASNVFRGGWITCTKQYFGELPIRHIDFDNPSDVSLHDKMVLLVERMLDLNKKKAAEKNPNILEQLETQISATDRQIDRLVYQLYALTPEEIAIVEGGR